MPINEPIRRIHVLDSHTGGEPTRLVVSGGPDLGSGPLSDRLRRFQRSYDSFRTAVVNEPRGSDVLVGALLCEPSDATCDAGAIFFNNVGYLGMCGHGTIGLIVSLAHLGKISPGTHRIETPVGIVTTTLHVSGAVTVENVSSYRSAANVTVNVPGHGVITGDIAWGGNWFYLVEDHSKDLSLQNAAALTEYTSAILDALTAQGITGANGAPIDHIELFSPGDATDDSTNFVLCPGKAYDRSPCGTGTSAKLACLYAEGKLAPGAIWRQRGILGSVFEGSFRLNGTNGASGGNSILPSITGTAHITAESTLLLDPADPFCMGIAT